MTIDQGDLAVAGEPLVGSGVAAKIPTCSTTSVQSCGANNATSGGRPSAYPPAPGPASTAVSALLMLPMTN